MRFTGALLVLWVLGVVPAHADPEVVASITFPGKARPSAAANDGSLFYVALPGNRREELYAIDATDPYAPEITWSLELGTRANDLAMSPTGEYLYLATLRNNAELMVVDVETAEVVATLNLPTNRDGYRFIAVISGFVVMTTKPQNSLMTWYVLDTIDPLAPTIIASTAGPVLEPRPQPWAIAQYLDGDEPIYWGRTSSDPSLSVIVMPTRNDEFRIIADLDHPLELIDQNADGVRKLACLGDSNSFPNQRTQPVNYIAHLTQQIWSSDLTYRAYAALGAGVVQHGMTQMQRAIDTGADAAILAFGTNDLSNGFTVQETLDAYQAATDLGSAAGLMVYVALTPPILREGRASFNALAVELNDEILNTFPPDRIIDFHNDFTEAEFIYDDVHMNGAGHVLRGERVINQLTID